MTRKAGSKPGAAASSSRRRYKFDHVIVVTYGRSGSTLLMGLLNSIPGALVRGENYNALFHQHRSIRYWEQTASYEASVNDSRHPWFGCVEYDVDRFKRRLRKAIQEMLLGTRAVNRPKLLGFKEIRFFDVYTDPDYPSYFDFLEDVFPRCAFVLNTRDHDEVSRSGWWREVNSDELKAGLHAFEETTRSVLEGRRNVFEIDYADVKSASPRLEALFQFLGASYDREQILEILRTPHSLD